jgi:phosphoglycerol transferase MdoB-like AlkP superfamily enzyme
MHRAVRSPRRWSWVLVEGICATYSALAFLYWDRLLGAAWPVRHGWLFHDGLALMQDVAWVNLLCGLSVYALARVLLNRVPAALLAVGVGLGLAAAAERKMQFLDMPILPWDLWFATNLEAFTDFLGWPRALFWPLVCGVMLVLLVGVWGLRRHVLRQRGHGLAAVVAGALVLLWNAWVVQPVTPRFLSGQMHVISWDLGANHANFGPYYALLGNLKFMNLPRADDAALEASRVLDQAPAPGSAQAEASQPDVVVVLSEAFTDLPVRIFGVPYTCLADAPPARLVSPSWGGFTANVEAEVLTGYPHALFPVGAVPYQMYLKRPLPSALPNVFRKAGYETAAVHTFNRSFFSRPTAYEMLGFSRYQGLEDLPQAPLRGQYVDDQVLFQALLQALDAPGSAPRFLHAVSMMAHLPYDWPGRYPVDPRLPARLPAGLERHGLSLLQYASMLYDHERMFCDFLAELRARPRRTVVLFYGDHYPSFGSMQVYRDLHRVLGPNEPFDLVAQYSKPPLALFDSQKGFLPVPAEVPGYNLGGILLRASGMTAPGPWAMSHKRDNTAIAPGGVYVANHQSAGVQGRAQQVAQHPEFEVLRAHAQRHLFGGDAVHPEP